MNSLAALGCERDLRQAVIWLSKGNSEKFWILLGAIRQILEESGNLDVNFKDQFCYRLGWGLYWHQYGSEDWNNRTNEEKALGNFCLDYYCSCVEQQQKSIFTFLSCWNRSMGIKGPGQMIAQMVWEDKENNLVEPFALQSDAETKRIKK
jgi:hypothetical protein